MEAGINPEAKISTRNGKETEKTEERELLLANGQKVVVQTSTRQMEEGEKSTFVSINTGCFRIKVVQRIRSDNQIPHYAQIGFSKTSETENLATIETLSLSLNEAIKIAEELNEKVDAKVPKTETLDVTS